ncbi:MAG TPA: dihydropyrimidinase [Tenuifilaceae bacterium]|nr:dihydropyrimidinase [Tenuifilaceae bacterium]
MELLIKNPTIVTSARTFQADVLVENGIIKAVGENLILNLLNIIDAEGKFLFPGGIDPHVHMHLPTPAGFSADGFLSGSKSALRGGTTTLIDFVTPNRGQSLVDALNIRIEEAKNSVIDYTFHVSPVEWRETTEQEIRECVKLGFPSFKVYMAYKSSVGLNYDVLEKVLTAVAAAGGMVTVHAELGDEIDILRSKFCEEGKTVPLYHPLSRPPHTESEAVKRIIEMAGAASCPLYIVHVSTKESLTHIKEAQENGQKVFAETCPHYLLLNDSVFQGNFDETSKYVLSPPLRKKEDSQALWNAISDGIVQTIGTDHCPFSLNQKKFGLNDFRKIPNGAGGVEHRLELLFTYGVLKNKISFNRFVDVTSTGPAKIFGLYPNKGEIAEGSDADLVIWNPNIENVISAKTHLSRCDQNIFESFPIKGFPEFVIKSGNIVDLNNEQSLQQGNLLRRRQG